MIALPRRRIRAEGDRSQRARLALAALAVFALLVSAASLAIGPSGIAPGQVPALLLAGPEAAARSTDALILWQIRLPRLILGLLVGGALASSGALMQGLFRNPLADPGLIGVSSGAALAAVATIVLGGGMLAGLAVYAVPVMAFLGALATTFALYAIATRGGQTSVATLLLGGVALGAATGAATGLLIFLSNDQQLRDFTFWSMGGLGGATWPGLAIAGSAMALVIVIAPRLARAMNAITLGEAQAYHLGIDTQRLKRRVILLVALSTGAAVALAGTIGFVGLIVPHLIRMTLGPDHRALLPGAALLGAALLVLADMAARSIASPAELPIGIVTATVGAPFFLWLLLRRRGLGGL